MLAKALQVCRIYVRALECCSQSRAFAHTHTHTHTRIGGAAMYVCTCLNLWLKNPIKAWLMTAVKWEALWRELLYEQCIIVKVCSSHLQSTTPVKDDWPKEAMTGDSAVNRWAGWFVNALSWSGHRSLLHVCTIDCVSVLNLQYSVIGPSFFVVRFSVADTVSIRPLLVQQFHQLMTAKK